MSVKKSTFVYTCIIGCISFSSVLIFVRCVLSCYAFFHAEQLLIRGVGIGIGILFGGFSLYANYCIMHQTFCESSRYFAHRSKGTRWLSTFFCFKNTKREIKVRWFSSLCYAVYYSQPAIYMIFTSSLIIHLDTLFRGSLALISASIMILSYYLLTQNYLDRLFVVISPSTPK